MKILQLVIMGCLWGVGSLGSAVVPPTTQPQTMAQVKEHYLEEISKELDQLENLLDKKNGSGTVDHRAAEDIELMIKSTRGDILKYQSQEPPLRASQKTIIEAKVEEIHAQLGQGVSPAE